jgi:hypothetical protein
MVGGYPLARLQLSSVKPVDRREQVRGALDECDERAHGERSSALREVAAIAVEGSQQAELLVDEPSESLAHDLRAFVGRRDSSTQKPVAPYDASDPAPAETHAEAEALPIPEPLLDCNALAIQGLDCGRWQASTLVMCTP